MTSTGADASCPAGPERWRLRRLMQMRRGSAQDKEGEPASPVVAIGWSLNGRRVVTAEEKGRIRLWSVETGGVVYSCVLESISLTVQISPDANTVLACPNAGTYNDLMIHYNYKPTQAWRA